MLDKDRSGTRNAGFADPWSRGLCAIALAEIVHGEKQFLVWLVEGYQAWDIRQQVPLSLLPVLLSLCKETSNFL